MTQHVISSTDRAAAIEDALLDAADGPEVAMADLLAVVSGNALQETGDEDRPEVALVSPVRAASVRGGDEVVFRGRVLRVVRVLWRDPAFHPVVAVWCHGEPPEVLDRDAEVLVVTRVPAEARLVLLTSEVSEWMGVAR